MDDRSLCTPTRTPHSRSRSVLGEIPAAASCFNVPSPAPTEKQNATTAAANRLIDFNRRAPRNTIHRRSLTTASGLQHHRQVSKAARYHFLQRPASSDSERASDDDSVTIGVNRVDLGDAQNPIMHFRPQLWRHLERKRKIINLDLFWPQRWLGCEEEEDPSDHHQCEREIFPLQGLKPLCEFRSLRSLRLGGMLQSYQTYVWQTCWLNPGLEELVLEMALEPTIHLPNHAFLPIHGPWRRKTIREARTDYLGGQGDGSLSMRVGIGEYLDKDSMASARNLVASQGASLRYLPIVKLVLAGFVVDAGPFFRWFNPMRLRKVEFAHGCIDAGFALPSHMHNLVTVSWPGHPPEECKLIRVMKMSQQDLKHILLSKTSITHQASNGLKAKINFILTRNWFSSARSHSLKAWKAKQGRQPQSAGTSQASSSSDISSFRQRSSSGISLKSKIF